MADDVRPWYNGCKPCPFCGNAIIEVKRNHRGVRLYCSNCKVGFIDFNNERHLSFEEQMATLEVLRIKWNERA